MSQTPIKAVVFGGTGYVGGELLRLIATHPNYELVAAVSDSRNGDAIAATFAHLYSAYGDLAYCGYADWLERLDSGDKLALFCAAPHGTSAALIGKALSEASSKGLDCHVVDASADFRYSDQAAYEAVYNTKHGAPDLLADFSCGVPEHLTTIATRHIGHPGCFATAILLASMPLAVGSLNSGPLFVSGITGSTGSGRNPQPGTHHPERHSNLYAYKPLQHRHAPEIEAQLQRGSGTDVKVNFVPHSGPFARGIHATVMTVCDNRLTREQLLERYHNSYAASPFVQIIDGTPKLKNVVASNYAHIGVAVENGTILVACVIDNLIKGAAGGAVQWMNRLWDLPETAGLQNAAPAWT